jgi:uncharacterized Tic20 family protein
MKFRHAQFSLLLFALNVVLVLLAAMKLPHAGVYRILFALRLIQLKSSALPFI